MDAPRTDISVAPGAWLGGDVNYNRVGHGYTNHRRPDPRIAAMIHAALGDSRTIVNVGAGAGSYEPTDRVVIPIEPSAVMRAQRPSHLAPAIEGVAESLPLGDGAADGAMATLTVHQWADLDRGLHELRRVARGPVVVLTFDGDEMHRFWLADYIPELIEVERRRMPPIAAIGRSLGGEIEVLTVPIASDCTDGFTEAYYARPERFLDPQVRACQSCWRFLEQTVQDRFVADLQRDLESGAWDRRYGHWREMPEFLGSVRLIVSRPDR